MEGEGEEEEEDEGWGCGGSAGDSREDAAPSAQHRRVLAPARPQPPLRSLPSLPPPVRPLLWVKAGPGLAQIRTGVILQNHAGKLHPPRNSEQDAQRRVRLPVPLRNPPLASLPGAAPIRCHEPPTSQPHVL